MAWKDIFGALSSTFDPKGYDDMQRREAVEGNNAYQSAYPALVDYTKAAGTTDPRFWNDPESREVLAKQGVVGDIGPFATPGSTNNPYILQSLSEMRGKAQGEADLGEYIKGDASPNVLARIAMSSPTQQHLSAFRNLAADFQETTPTDRRMRAAEAIRKEKEVAESRNREAFSNLGYVNLAESPEDLTQRLSDVVEATGASPDFGAKVMQPLLKQFTTEKQEKFQFKPNLYLAQTPEGESVPEGYVLDAIIDAKGNPIKSVGVPHKPTAVTSAELRLAGIPAYTPVTGAYDANGNLILLNRKSGTVAPAQNPQGIDVGGGKADQRNLENLTKLTGVLKSNEIEANKNFDQLTGLYKKLGNGTIPALNVAMNHIKENLGAPEPGTAAGVAYEAMTQYARVVNKQTTGGAITDTARREINELLRVLKVNPRQFDAKVGQYRKTMKNAMESQDEAIKLARKAPSAKGTGKKVVERRRGKSGNILIMYSDGTIEYEKRKP